MGRGHHRVLLGMAAGVGKTYRALQECQAEAEAGRDVVIGWLEAHARPATTAQAAGLEVVPRRAARVGGLGVEELDLPGILARAPELCLVDELAHSNPPGSEHEKRFGDVEELLRAGIDVLSTVNVQHLESLNDEVLELTGTRVRETLPDAVVTGADEVVLVDLTPEALIARLRRGEVYRPDRVADALNGFFKVETLAALREVALRQVAEGVGQQRLGAEEPATRRPEHRREADGSGRQAVAERLLAVLEPDLGAQRVARRAWRSARRLGAELDLLLVRAPGRTPTEDERLQVEALRRLASVLGVTLLVEESDDLVAAVARVADDRASTYVLLAPPARARGLARLREPLLTRLVRELDGVDVRVVADRSRLARRRDGPA